MARNIIKLGALEAPNTAFLLCDLQESFRRHIKHFGECVKTANKMVRTYLMIVYRLHNHIQLNQSITISQKVKVLLEKLQRQNPSILFSIKH